MKTHRILIYGFALGLSILRLNSQTTVSLQMQDANFPVQFNDGGDFFDNGGAELGMWANSGNKHTVAWRMFKTSSDNSGSNRALQVGDELKITVAATRAFGQIGFSLNEGSTPGTLNYANRTSGSRCFVNTDNYGSWYVNHGGGSSSLGYNPIQDTYKDYIFTLKLTSASTINVVLTVDGVDYPARNLTLNGTGAITHFSVYGSDMWDGNSNDNAYWKQTSQVTSTQSVELGYFLASGSFTPGLISDGLEANSTTTGSVNNVLVGGNAGSSVILSQNNSYTGTTTINANATCQLGATGTAPNSPLGTTAAGTTVSSGGVLDLNGNSLATAEPLTLNGDGISSGGALINTSATAATYQGGVSLGSGSRITATTGNINISGALNGSSHVLYLGGAQQITLSGKVSGAGGNQSGTTTSIYKDGSGTAILSDASNDFTGALKILGGTLALGASGVIPDNNAIVLDGGTLSTAGYSETVGVLNLNSNSSISFASGAHTLAFANSAAQSWAGTTLTIANYEPGTGNVLKFGTDNTGLTAAQLAKINFSGYGTGARILSNGEVVPQKYYAVVTGTWSTPGTWIANAIPPSGADVVIDANVTLTLDANPTVGSLTIPATATFTGSDNTARTLTLISDAAGSTTTLVNNGTWTNGVGGCTVIFKGNPSTADAVHTTSGTIAFQTVKIEHASGAAFNVGTDFGAGATVSTALEIGPGGFNSNNFPSGFFGGSAELIFNQGAGEIYDVLVTDNTWDNSIVPATIRVNSGTLNLQTDRSVATFIVASGASTTIQASSSATVTTALTNNGTITVENNGALVQTTGSTLTNTGTFNVKRTIPAGGGTAFRFMGSAIQNLAVNGFGITPTGTNGGQVVSLNTCSPTNIDANSPYGNIMYMDESATTTNNCTQELWFVKSAGNLTNGLGYSMMSSSGTTHTLSGTVNNGNVAVAGRGRSSAGNVNLPGSGSSTRGWHLLSNPYPSPIQLSSTNMPAGFDQQIQLWDVNNGNWVAVNTSVSTANIGIGQAFQVRVSTQGNTETFTFTNAMRTTGAPTFYTQPLDSLPHVELNLNLNGKTDRHVVFFTGTASDSFDAEGDANRLQGSHLGTFMYGQANNQQGNVEELSFNALNESVLTAPGYEVPVFLQTQETGTASVEVQGLSSLPLNVQLGLKDSSTQLVQWLSNGQVVNLPVAGPFKGHRFSLVFKELSSGVQTNGGSDFKMWSNGHRVRYWNTGLGNLHSVRIFNVLGQEMAFERNLKAEGGEIQLNSPLAAGMYTAVFEQDLGQFQSVKFHVQQ